MENTVTEDFLDVDKAIPGQNYVCMSFVSPEKIIKRKESYIFYKFLKEKFNFEDSFEKLEEQLQDYQTDNNTEINDEFNKIENFRTNVRGVKIRGTYDTHKEASIRAKVLQKSDSSFHVFVGQVGYWLPWEPNVDEISDQHYQEDHLNNLVSRYKENELERDNYYAQETEERKKKCLEDNLKTSNTAEEASENVDNLIENLDKEESHANLKEEYQKYQDKIESSGPKNEKSD
jgi:hypothetical protein